MGLFRRKAQVVDAEHLRQEAPPNPVPAGPVVDPGAVPQVGAPDVTPGGASPDFRLTVQDVFLIKGRGVVATGQVESGSVSVGATVSLSRQGELLRRMKVNGVEMFRKTLEVASAGANVGLLLDDVSREDLASGDVLSA